ncbi:MAG: hypothetical protein AAF560_27850 [Acidobacteriota bacterium]
MKTAKSRTRILSAFCIAMLGACGAARADDFEALQAAPRLLGPAGDFEAEYLDCDEFAGLGLVPLANVADLVPDDYTVIQPIPDLALIVAQAGSCAEIQVEDGRSRPGTFAQFGVAVVPPLAPGNGDFYQILFTTNHPRLAFELRRRGVRARFAPRLSYRINDQPELEVKVPRPHRLAFELSGPITLPDPAAPANPISVFNYYSQSRRHGNILQQNTVEGIRLGEGSAVILTAIGSEMQAIVGGDFLMFPFFSSPEVFDRNVLSVVVDAF